MDVKVVKARYTPTLPGRKTELRECPWLQKLHPFGLWNNSFLPKEETRVLRTYLRPRANLVAAAGSCLPPVAKARTEMHGQWANVLSDLSGTTGMAIWRALLPGAC